MKKSMAGKAGRVMDFCQGCKPSLLSLVGEVQAPAAPSQGSELKRHSQHRQLWVLCGNSLVVAQLIGCYSDEARGKKGCQGKGRAWGP